MLPRKIGNPYTQASFKLFIDQLQPCHVHLYKKIGMLRLLSFFPLGKTMKTSSQNIQLENNTDNNNNDDDNIMVAI